MNEESTKNYFKTYGKHRWTLAQLKAELVYKTTWGASVVADLVAEVERLQATANAEQHRQEISPNPSSSAGIRPKW